MERAVRIFRYDPSSRQTRFDTFVLAVPNETTTTILDVLLRLQQEQDPTLAFRYACRVNMCGSCGLVINGREALACKTNVSDIHAGKEITIRPLNHFPVIKDLVVDMEPFFSKYDGVLPFFEPRQESAQPARIRPDSPERLVIGDATECIACGCCVSSCTMAQHHEGYAGPAALNRAFTLLADSRDGLFQERLERALESCYDCRTEFNCTEVCPKNISPTRAIKYIQRLAVKHPLRSSGKGWGALIAAAAMTFIVGMLYLGLTRAADARPYGQTIPVPDRQLSASEARGLHLFATLQCAYCHQIEGRGGHRRGPDLSNTAAKHRTRDYLVRYIREPQSVSRASAMPPYSLPESDLRALADFLLALDFSSSPPKILQPEEVLHE